MSTTWGQNSWGDNSWQSDTVTTTLTGQSLTSSVGQAEDGIRDVERSRGLGDVYKRQI